MWLITQASREDEGQGPRAGGEVEAHVTSRRGGYVEEGAMPP